MNLSETAEDGPTVVPLSYLTQVQQNNALIEQLKLQRALIKTKSRQQPDSAGEQTEEIFSNLIRELIPDEFKIVKRARIHSDIPEDSPQLDLVILKPGGEKLLNNQNTYPRESVLAAFECKLTLRKRDFEKASITANTIKSNYATGFANDTSAVRTLPVCKPYFGLLGLSWEGGEGLENSENLRQLILNSFRTSTIGRQVDCIFVPDHSFYETFHENYIHDKYISFGVRYEPVLKYEFLKELQKKDKNILVPEPRKLEHHNPLMGLGLFLARIIGEFSENYKHLARAYDYYGHIICGHMVQTPHLAVDIDSSNGR